MTTGESSATAGAPASQPEHEVSREFGRLAGQVRLISAGVLLLFRSSLVVTLVLTWAAVTEPYANNPILPEQLTEVMVTAAITLWCMQYLMPWLDRPLRTAALTIAAAILWTALAALLFWEVPLAQRPGYILHLALIVTAAGAVATLASRYARMLLQPRDPHAAERYAAQVSANAPPVSRFCPTCAAALGEGEICPACGRHLPKPDLRPRMQRELGRMQGAWARALLGLRCLALLVGMLVLVRLAQAWVEQLRPDLRDPLPELIPWFVLGGFTGAGIGLLTVHRGRLVATATAAGATLLSLAAGAGLALLGTPAVRMAGLPGACWQAAAVAAAVAGVSALVVHWLLGTIIARFAPAASAQLLLGRRIERPTPVSTPAPAPSPRTCERCGYQLEGLPATRCSHCAVVGLRCPECGHAQPANTLNARLLGRIYKVHTGIRVVTWLAGAGISFWLLLPWLFVGSLGSGNRTLGWEEALGYLLVSVVLLGPIRILLLHGRRMWLMSLLVTVLPAAVMLVVVNTKGPEEFAAALWAMAGFFLPCWLIAAFATPHLWRGWLWGIYGSELGAELYRWHRSPAYRHGSPEQILSDPDRALGREFALRCGGASAGGGAGCAGCAADIPPTGTAACPACGIHALACPACAQPRGISAVRVGFEALVHRLRLAGLALLALLAAVTVVVLIIADLINGEVLLQQIWERAEPYAYSDHYLANSIESAVNCALFFGILGRLVLLRRRTLPAAATVGGMHALWFAVMPLPFISAGSQASALRLEDLVLILGVALACGGLAFAAALCGKPLLHLLMYLLPIPVRMPLRSWLNGEQTLRAASCLLPGT